MKNPLHVQRGQRIRADHINRIADAAFDPVKGGHGTLASSIPGGKRISLRDVHNREHPAIIVLGCNRTSQIISAKQVMRARRVLSTVNIDDRMTVVDLANYQTGYEDKAVVAIDTILPGQIGRVVTSGVVYALVRSDQETPASTTEIRASPTAQSPYRRTVTLSTDGSGLWPVLSVASYSWTGFTTDKYALIQIGGGTGIGGSSGDNWQFVWNEGGEG